MLLRLTALAYLREGDVFVITRLSRAMRLLRHMIELAEQLRERGIGLVVLRRAIDTTAPHGRLVFHILATIDEVQRELIVEGTNEGLAAAGPAAQRRPEAEPDTGPARARPGPVRRPASTPSRRSPACSASPGRPSTGTLSPAPCAAPRRPPSWPGTAEQ
jgi:hypothetical protein